MSDGEMVVFGQVVSILLDSSSLWMRGFQTQEGGGGNGITDCMMCLCV